MSQGEIIKNMDNVLKQLTTNFNELISREQLLRFLDQRCTQLFDRIIFEQLYSRMPKGINGYVSLNDFKQIVLQAYQTLTTKIAQSSTIMDQKRNELNAISTKLKQLTNTERYNNYNISLQSTLTIQILDGKVEFPGNSLVFIKIGCDDIIYQTKYANRNQPQWGDTFTFPIKSGQEEIWLAILDEESSLHKQIGGQVQLQLQQFYDQKIHEKELILMDQHNITNAATVKVTVQWIHSQTKYLEQEILEVQQQMQELKFDIDEYNNDIKAIFQPFQLESVGDQNYQSDQSQKHQQIVNQLYSTQQNYSAELPKQNTEITPNQWLRISLILTLMFFVSAVAESFIKTQYLDFLILFYSLWFYMNNFELQSLLHIKIMTFMYILSIVYDGFWLFVYFKPYLKNEVKFDHQEDTFHQYTLLLCILILIEKLFIILSYFNLYLKCPNARQNIFDEQYEICFGSYYYQQKLAESQKQAQYSSKVIRQSTPNMKYVYPLQQQSQSQRQKYSLRYVQ